MVTCHLYNQGIQRVRAEVEEAMLKVRTRAKQEAQRGHYSENELYDFMDARTRWLHDRRGLTFQGASQQAMREISAFVALAAQTNRHLNDMLYREVTI
jgi:hypothetical protein